MTPCKTEGADHRPWPDAATPYDLVERHDAGFPQDGTCHADQLLFTRWDILNANSNAGFPGFKKIGRIAPRTDDAQVFSAKLVYSWNNYGDYNIL